MAICEDCGSDRSRLHRHHVIPKSQGGSDGPENILNICGNCHEDRHTGPDADSIPWELAHTPEAKAKRSATMLRWWQDADYRAKQKASRTGIWTDERRAAHRARVKGKPMQLTDEQHERRRQAARDRWARPEYRAKILEARARQTNYRKKKAM